MPMLPTYRNGKILKHITTTSAVICLVVLPHLPAS